MTSNTPLLTIDGVSKTFYDGLEPLPALRPVRFDIAAGEFVCLLGPSGCGKSTLLRIVGGLLRADTGNVLFREQRLREPHNDIGFVFQSTNLMPWRTVLQNVLLPLEVQQKKVSEEACQRAISLLEWVGLRDFVDAYPKQLSGGMRQRVVLARALVYQPELLLMDEPFGALDALTRERLNLELLDIHEQQANTILMVTHSIPEAVFLADRVLILSTRPGEIIAEVQIDLPRPRPLSVMGSERFGQLTMDVRSHIAIDRRMS
ncbi:MAG: ABC transporter ATP-binding protein [Chloroflexota bacterium]